MKARKIIYPLTIVLLLSVLIVLIYLMMENLNTNFYTQDNNEHDLEIVDDKIRIGFSIGTLKEERWIKDRDILMAKVKELGADIIVQNANNDDKDQLKQVKYLLSQDIDVLIIAPNDLKKAAFAVELAKKRGVKVISYDRLVLNSDIDMYISFDNVKVGELMAKSVLRKMTRGNLLIINGPQSDNNTMMIKKGYDKILQTKVKNKEIEIISEEWAQNWMKEDAFKVTDSLLQNNKKIDAVIAGNDSLAGGSIEALSEHRLAGKVIVVGQDADLAGCQRVVEGTQHMTVYKPIEKLADVTAKMAIKLARGEKINIDNFIDNGKYNVPYYVLEPIAVDRNNIESTVIKDGFHISDEVYKNLP